MSFGATCSPFCAQYVKNINAEKFEKTYPEKSVAVKKQHYVDDYLDSFSNIDKAKETTNQVIKIHQHAGYYIRNFISNSQELLETIPEERRHKSFIKPMEDKESQAEKVLGVYWNTKDDCLAYQIKWNSYGEKLLNNEMPTMREVLAYVMSIYDPMGLISDLSIHGKILMQELHKATTKWDDVIPNHLHDYWKMSLSTIKEAENLSIPRYITNGNVESIELHTFVDASEDVEASRACLICPMGKRWYGRDGFLHERGGDQEGPLRRQHHKLPMLGGYHANANTNLPTAVIVYEVVVVLAGILSLGTTVYFLYCWFRSVDHFAPLIDSFVEPVKAHHPTLDVVAHTGASNVLDRVSDRAETVARGSEDVSGLRERSSDERFLPNVGRSKSLPSLVGGNQRRWDRGGDGDGESDLSRDAAFRYRLLRFYWAELHHSTSVAY